MATYKVIQDIEAEDKLLIWMTPRQAIYAAIVLISGFIWFMLASNGAWWLGIIFLPHMILFSVLAGPFMHDQPSEVWLLARVQFALKPRRRIWDQSGLKELVTVTVPKRIERRLTDGLSQTEVKSRLQALANTIDSRGWAVKNVNVNLYAQPSYATANISTDRLVDTTTLPQEVPTHDVSAADDMLDERSNPTAQNLDRMIHESAQAHRQQAIATMQNVNDPKQTQPDYWFLNATAGQAPTAPSGFATFDHNQTVIPGNPVPGSFSNVGPTTADEEAFLEKVHTQKERPAPGQSRLKTIKPLSQQQEEAKRKQKEKAEKAKQEAVKPVVNPEIQRLSQSNDLNLSTLSRQAKKELGDDGEVVISLR
jgi:hypothetical protein